MNRQTFLKSSLLASGAAVSASFIRAQPVADEEGRGPGRGPRTDLRKVYEFVQAAHRDLPKVKSMLAADSALIHARWDWGDGDWESGLEGAAHMGQREIVRYLLTQGARNDVFSAAMLGHTETVKAMIDLETATVDSRGPHGINLMFYVGYGGKPAMADAILQHVEDRGPQCNRAIHTATLSNHVELVGWLIENGATDINTPNFFDKTPLDAATERGFTELAELLRQHGGVSAL
ncbi:MAG: ankyrin repeat domain-containing protein [Opitutaceae bacterium]|jgi:hypothetical protein|nr:ankyrin repeat domain-containing protein [Opitutaceae bacterium]